MEGHMSVTKMIAMIFLAIYLILTGLAMMSEVNLAPMAKNIVNLIAMASGVLILISVGKTAPHKEKR
jgi:hypothetical protein